MKNTVTKILLSILVVSLSLFTSCKEQEENSESTTTPNVNSTTQENSTNASQAPDLNPRHGEPYHRCDLPVGAPLEQAGTTQQNTSTQSPVRLRSSTPKINPPHGEPGHSCSIPVGAPLEG
ncbi:hypothetical protein [Salegentibacter sp. F14]